jgi:hypothetical protein
MSGNRNIAAIYVASDYTWMNDADVLPFHDECIANARLIAAAPDLLAACEAMFDERSETEDFLCWMDDREKQLRAAIAKARGEPS